MNILAFDCSTSNLQIALLNNHNLIEQINIENQQSHSELLVSKIQEILNHHQLTYHSLNLIAVGNGPSSFTATRVALSVAKMIRIACQIPVITVNSCELLAFIYKYQNLLTIPIHNQVKLTSLINFNNKQVFCGEYLLTKNSILTHRTEQIIDLKDLKSDKNQIILADDQNLKNYFFDQITIIKKQVFQLGLFALEKYQQKNYSSIIEPIYLLQPSITVRKK